MKKSQNPRFEVDFKTRLEQSRTASNASRLPRLGYREYRVYDLEKKKNKVALNQSYVMKTGPVNIIGTGGKYTKTVMYLYVDSLFNSPAPTFKTKWLKPKQATLLRLQGYRVEEQN